MTDQDSREMKKYVGYVWIGEKPGKRISLWARSADEAMRLVEKEYGEGHPFSIHNVDDAEKPR